MFIVRRLAVGACDMVSVMELDIGLDNELDVGLEYALKRSLLCLKK